MVKLIILENYEKINNFIDQSFLHCLLCRCKIQQNSWKMLLGLSLSPDYGIHLYAGFMPIVRFYIGQLAVMI